MTEFPISFTWQMVVCKIALQNNIEMKSANPKYHQCIQFTVSPFNETMLIMSYKQQFIFTLSMRY